MLKTLGAAALLALSASSLALAQEAQKPNILVIFGDDIGQTNLSIYSNGLMGYRTPNIDRIAREGMIFTDYYGEQSCTAGRSSFITGQHGLRTGLTKVGLPGARSGLQKEDPTIAQALKSLGYATGQFGKNHLGDRNEFLPASHNAGLPLDLEFAPYHGPLEGAVAVEPFSWPDYWFGAVHATADGRTFWAQAVAPTTGELGKPDQRIALATDLTVTRVMRKLSDTATDKAVFTEAVMELVDGNPHDPFGYECPWWTAYEPEDRCKHTMQGYIQITVDAWATLPNGGYLTLRHAKAHVQFFGWRRQQYLEADTYAESDVPVWNKFDFKVMVDDTNDKNYPLQWAGRSLIAPAAVTIPLDTVATGAEYTSNTLIRTHPDGLDVEAVREAPHERAGRRDDRHGRRVGRFQRGEQRRERHGEAHRQDRLGHHQQPHRRRLGEHREAPQDREHDDRARHQQDRGALTVQFLDDVEDRVNQHGSQAHRWLVQEQEFWFHKSRHQEGQGLSLST